MITILLIFLVAWCGVMGRFVFVLIDVLRRRWITELDKIEAKAKGRRFMDM